MRNMRERKREKKRDVTQRREMENDENYREEDRRKG